MEVFHSKSETFNIKFLHIRRLLAIMMGIPSEKMQGGVTMNHDTVQNLIAMIGYMAIVIGIGLYFSKRSNRSSEEYFLGGRSLGPWVAAMSAEASRQ